MEHDFSAVRLKAALLMFAFFGMVTSITAFYPFAFMNKQSRAVNVIHNAIDALFSSWLGEQNTAILFSVLTVAMPILCIKGIVKSFSEKQALKAINTAEKGSFRPKPRHGSQVLFGEKK